MTREVRSRIPINNLVNERFLFLFLDSCDWDSPCNIGVCYYNSTGCPVTGYHRFHTSAHDYYTLNATTYTDLRDTSKGLVILVMSVVLVAMVTILVCEWKLGQTQ